MALDELAGGGAEGDCAIGDWSSVTGDVGRAVCMGVRRGCCVPGLLVECGLWGGGVLGEGGGGEAI